MSNVRTRPMDRPAIDLNTPRSSTATANTVITRKKVRMASITSAFPFDRPT
jgi:hypothetical protein